MARIDWVERRLLNWARYVSGSTGYASADPADVAVDNKGWDAPTVIPTDDGEAEHTGRAVEALEPELRRTVHVYYLQGGFMAGKLRQLGLETEGALYSRIDRAHRALARWLADDAQAKRIERGRVEQLQRQSVDTPPAPAPSPTPARLLGSRLAAWLAERRAKGFAK